ncbi:MAG: hypothetical protein AAGU04_09160, partial [Anaerolineaceae bacterium]
MPEKGDSMRFVTVLKMRKAQLLFCIIAVFLSACSPVRRTLEPTQTPLPPALTPTFAQHPVKGSVLNKKKGLHGQNRGH